MADMTVRVPQGYPVGTTLSVYVDRVGDVIPQGTPVSTCVVAADSTALITGITPQIPYQVGAVIGGTWRSFLVEMAVPLPTDLNSVIAELAAHEADAIDVHGTAGTLATDAELAAAVASVLPVTLFDAKGDLLVGTADNTPTRLGVGSDGQILTADAASAPGVKWAAAAAGYTDAQARAALAAESALTPDKVAWESPSGTDVVELWGDDVSLSSTVIDAYIADYFAANNLPDATKWTQLDNGGFTPTFTANGFSAGHGYYVNQTTNAQPQGYQWLTNPRTADREIRLRHFGEFGANSFAGGMREPGLLISHFSATDNISVDLAYANAGANPVTLVLRVYAHTNTGFTTTQLAVGTAFTAPAVQGTAVDWWLVVRKVGNVITGEFWAVHPDTPGATPIGTVSHTLSAAVSTRGSGGTDAGNHGTGQNKPVGIFQGAAGSGATGHRYGEFELRDKGVSTHRRLMAALTPSTGVRQVFPVLDVGPDGSLRSPTLLEQVNAGGLADSLVDALLSYTAQSGMLLSDPVARTLLVRQGSVWTRLAPLASPAFTGTPSLPTGSTGITQAAGDSSTKLATTAYADRLAQQVFAINTQTGTAYTAVLADAGKVIESNNASAMTITIPPNSSVAYPIGTRLRGVRLGAGTLTIVQGASVILRNKIEAAGTTNRTVTAQYGAWEAYKRATDEWVLTGDIA